MTLPETTLDTSGNDPQLSQSGTVHKTGEGRSGDATCGAGNESLQCERVPVAWWKINSFGTPSPLPPPSPHVSKGPRSQEGFIEAGGRSKPLATIVICIILQLLCAICVSPH